METYNCLGFLFFNCVHKNVKLHIIWAADAAENIRILKKKEKKKFIHTVVKVFNQEIILFHFVDKIKSFWK